MDSIGIDIGGTSVKLAAADRAGSVLWTARGAAYSRPSSGNIADTIRLAAGGRLPPAGEIRRCAAGLCVPGVLDPDRRTILQSVNLPALNGVRLAELVASALSAPPASLSVFTDAYATAYDLYASRNLAGRLFVLAIGTGVGAAVLDDGQPLSVDGDSPGHFGQLDVSVENHPVVGPDGGAGSLEGYLGADALARQYGPDPDWPARVRPDDPPVRALARALRIAHALYRPHHVCLAGGVGIRLGPVLPALRAAVAHQLTNIARPDWTLTTGDSDFHAAQGAARLAIGAMPPVGEPE